MNNVCPMMTPAIISQTVGREANGSSEDLEDWLAMNIKEQQENFQLKTSSYKHFINAARFRMFRNKSNIEVIVNSLVKTQKEAITMRWRNLECKVSIL